MSRPRIHFLCDANASVGFGHLSRCLKLAATLRRSCAIRFGGRFSPAARRRIAQDGYVIAAPSAQSADVAVVDIMFDQEDMDYYDRPRLLAIRRRYPRVVLLSSALTAPDDLPVDVVVGHVLRRAQGPSSARPFRTLAGLGYAPVSAEFRRLRAHRAPIRKRLQRVFLGFGASRDVRGVEAVLDALALAGFTGQVDLLLSPFHQRFEARISERCTPYCLRMHANVRSVAPLLHGADLAFGTYGNVTFEALCLGTPFAAVPVKAFQLSYARRLEKQGLLVCLGRDSELTAARVVAALTRLTVEKRRALSRNGRQSVDGRGIERIGRVIKNEAIRHASRAGRTLDR
jgi:spore coat polysaccharide biosynthesis predicted glycosyltransferase SpsG